MREGQARNLPPWNDVTVGKTSMPYKSKPERELDVPGFKVIVPVNERLAAAVEYRYYLLLKKSSYFDDDATHERQNMAKKIVIQLKDGIFSGKNLMLIFAFLQELKSTCDVCRIHEHPAMCIFKQFLTCTVNAGVEKPVTLTRFVSFYHEGALKSYSAIVQFLLRRYVTNDNIAKLYVEVRDLRHGSMG